jgi:hypothetical protein
MSAPRVVHVAARKAFVTDMSLLQRDDLKQVYDL